MSRELKSVASGLVLAVLMVVGVALGPAATQAKANGCFGEPCYANCRYNILNWGSDPSCTQSLVWPECVSDCASVAQNCELGCPKWYYTPNCIYRLKNCWCTEIPC